ncbi:MAG: hypothetical protein LAT67_04030 [Balneolales bacterium]|nr:hypothetical protein [Balneolales bacterium]
MDKVKRFIARHAINYKGFKTDRKIIVIESDDWGSIRMPSYRVYNELLKEGYPVNKNPYSQFDGLATAEDLECLFDVLLSFKDKKDNCPVITADTVVANPDFEKIKKSDFSKYHYEPFTTTLRNSSAHQGVFNVWDQGIAQKIFFPQFHGREHVNVEYWMQELQNPYSEARSLFEYGCWLISNDFQKKISFQAALDTELLESVESHKEIIIKGLDLFESIFKYRSKSFIANNFVYHSSLNLTLKKYGVDYIQGMKYQKHPILKNAKRELIRHFIGEQNSNGQFYLIRNCVFEPSQKPISYDNVGECLKDIRNAFLWEKPAIITAHRLNFIGSINQDNRKRNLKMFKELLSNILKEWPDVEFMNSADLGDYIKSKSF